MTRMFFLIPRLNEDIINEYVNEQVQELFEHLFIESMKVAGALLNLNDINKNS